MTDEIRPSEIVPASPPSRGSLLLGFVIAWGILLSGHALAVAMFLNSLNKQPIWPEQAILFVLVAPWLLVIGFAIWFMTKGKPRTAMGLAIGVASIIAVAVLLVAACFGLFFNAGEMH